MDHPTRRLPADDRPPRDAATHPTRRLDGSVPTPPTHCPRCDGPVQVFPTRPLGVYNPAGRKDIWLGLPPTAGVNAHVCLDCGFTELYTVRPRQLLGERE